MTRHRGTPDATATLLRRVAGFFEFLRAHGMTIGIGAEVDLGMTLHHVDVFDREEFRDACRTTLAKSPADLAALDAAFEEYWSSEVRAARPIPAAVTGRPPADGRLPSVSVPAGPTGTTRTVNVHVGIYSPEAPPGGHTLAPLAPRRLAAMRTGARTLRRLVATLPGRRFEMARRGRIDFRRTSRNAVGSSGEWVELRRKRRRASRAEALVLWDVSGSMCDHDSDLAALAYAIGRAMRRSRVFAFSTEVSEITGRLAGTPYRHALTAVARALGPAGGGTRIGRCLQEFRRDFGRLVHRRTTVVILSDGWDLGETDVLAAEVRWLHSRAHRVVWVNPYAGQPGFRPETAGMRQALPHIDLLLAPGDLEGAGRREVADAHLRRTPLSIVANG